VILLLPGGAVAAEKREQVAACWLGGYVGLGWLRNLWRFPMAVCHNALMVRVRGFAWGGESTVRAAALWLCAVGLVTACAALAQEAQEGKVPTLHAYANLVQVPTLVLTKDRKQMAPIAEGRFFVSLDGGPPFRVTHTRLEGDDPISLAIVLDVSQPFPTLMAKIDDAIAGLAPLALKPKDHVSIYSMDCSLVRAADDVPAEAEALKRGVDMALQPWRMHGRDRWKSQCKGASNLWDSLTIVTQGLHERPGRRVILAVTDGVDRGSKTSWNALRFLAQERGVAIFGLAEPNGPIVNFRPSGPENIFNSLCELSGGLVMIASAKALTTQLDQFTALLRGRYIVEFPHPVDAAGGYHSMEITIERADAFIRPSGIAIPVDDPAILNDPTTVRSDPSHAPALGKRKVLAPH